MPAGCFPEELPAGLIFGTARIVRCTPDDGGGFERHLADVKQLSRPIKPKRQPQPVWFRPF